MCDLLACFFVRLGGCFVLVTCVTYIFAFSNLAAGGTLRCDVMCDGMRGGVGDHRFRGVVAAHFF